MKLFKGHAIVEGRKSEYSLYDEKLATYTTDDEFDHDAAVGFIKLWGLPTKVQQYGANKQEGGSVTANFGEEDLQNLQKNG